MDDFLQPLDDDDDASNFVNIFADDNNTLRKRAEMNLNFCTASVFEWCKKYILRQITNSGALARFARQRSPISKQNW